MPATGRGEGRRGERVKQPRYNRKEVTEFYLMETLTTGNLNCSIPENNKERELHCALGSHLENNKCGKVKFCNT
jgi:hypothetical protein